MSKAEKVLVKILRGTSDKNINFETLRTLLSQLGFEERVKGSHHIWTHDRIAEVLNIQPKQGKAKPYQIKQTRKIILKYNLNIDEDGSQL